MAAWLVPLVRSLLAPRESRIQRIDVWMEALRIVNTRRDYYGRLFWQLPTITVSATVLFLGAVTEKNQGAPHWALVASAVFLFAIARVAHSIKKGQDSLEDHIKRIDTEITAILGDSVDTRFPVGNRRGSRLAVVRMIDLASAALMAAGIWKLALDHRFTDWLSGLGA